MAPQDPLTLSEILSVIFTHLSLRDRKSVRLTSRLFYSACNEREIITREKFLFSPSSCGRLRDFILGIEYCGAMRSTVDFFELPLDSMPERMWENIGPSIQTLFIYDCQVDRGIAIRNLILHCTNLTDLYLHPDALIAVEYQLWDDVLDAMIRKNIRRERLTYFKLFSGQSNPPESVFQKFFKIFPNIVTFRRTYVNDSSEGAFELPPMAERVEYRNIDFKGMYTTSAQWLAPFCSSHSRKLKKVVFQLKFTDQLSRTAHVENFFHAQTELEAITLETYGSENGALKPVLFLVLNRTSKLQHLNFKACAAILKFTKEETDQFFKGIGCLKSLVLHCFGLHADLANFGPSLMFSKMEKLTLQFSMPPKVHIYLAMMDRCPSLKWLYLSQIDQVVLRSIFAFHKDLRKLGVAICDTKSSLDDTDFIRPYPAELLKKLDKLELQIKAQNFEEHVTFLYRLDLSGLKYFHLRIERSEKVDCISKDEIARELLSLVARKMPRVEVLKLGIESNSPEILLHFVSIQCLKFLLPTDASSTFKFDRQIVEGLFRTCPSLVFMMDASRCYTRNDFGQDGRLRYSLRLQNNGIYNYMRTHALLYEDDQF